MREVLTSSLDGALPPLPLLLLLLLLRSGLPWLLVSACSALNC